MSSAAIGKGPPGFAPRESQSNTIKAVSFYRPELDAIRFLAFLAVYLFHGPRIAQVNWLEQAGLYGMGLFFFLSAFLITELLLREQKQTGTIHLAAFYLRRSLRIWPLYFAGVATALAWSYYVDRFRLNQHEIAYLLLIVTGFLGKTYHYNPAGVLWSISIEEIFYLIWPLAGKVRAFGWASLAIFACSSIALVTTSNVWYNPFTQFFYFAAGGLLALVVHRLPMRLPLFLRVTMMALAAGVFVYASTVAFELFRFGLGAIGCSLLMIGALNIDVRWVPRPLIYLGKISYGLYVFHLSCLVLITVGIDRLGIRLGNNWRALFIEAAAFAACTGLAALSYHLFETPFLKLKQRFEFVKSRPV